MAKGFFITSNANLEPTEKITISTAMPSSRNRSAASTAFMSKPLTIGGTPAGGTTRRSASSTLNCEGGISVSGTCFAQTAIFNVVYLSGVGL